MNKLKLLTDNEIEEVIKPMKIGEVSIDVIGAGVDSIDRVFLTAFGLYSGLWYQGKGSISRKNVK